MNKTLITIIVIVVLLLVGIGIYVAIQNNKAPVIPISQPPVQPSMQESLIGSLIGLISGFFNKKKQVPDYVQVLPIDADGCDANGFNKIGISCSIGGF